MPLSTVWNQLEMFERTLRRGPGLQKGQHPQPDQVQEAYVREAEEYQHAHQGSGSHYSAGGMTRYQHCYWPLYISPTIYTFDTVYSSFH